jgi:glucose/arabinose dehydrogenase
MNRLFLSILLAAVTVTGCKGTGAAATGTGDTSGAGPVETRPPNTAYKPAFEGQTRVKGVKTRAAYTTKVIATELKRPWGIAAMPDGRLLITEKSGTMRITTPAGQLSQPITGLPPVADAGQGGLLDVALDPQFATNRMVYWSFSHPTGDGGKNLTAVARGMLAQDERTIQNATIIYQATPAYDNSMHFGSRIVFDREGNIFLSTGERSDLETRPQAQDKTSGLGKIIRITPTGQPAAGGAVSSSRPEIYSYGHRNPQGLAIHPETKALWETEMGPRGGDELNIITAGKNYGWPTIGYGIEYRGEKVGAGITQQAGMEQPLYYWDPVLSPSGMTFYTGTGIPEWKNNLFICGLNSQHIARIVLDGTKVVGEERLLADEGQRFRDIAQGTDGYLYAVTDGGRLYRIGK